MPITALPTPPLPTDTPADFNTKAFALLGALPTFVTEANALETAVDADATTATTQATLATTKANEASISASSSVTSAILAQEWATKTTGAVSGGEFSAKKYAQDAAAAVAATVASIPAGSINDSIITTTSVWSSQKTQQGIANSTPYFILYSQGII